MVAAAPGAGAVGNGGNGGDVGVKQVTGYDVWFDLGSVRDPGCVETAVREAEEVVVRCTVVGP